MTITNMLIWGTFGAAAVSYILGRRADYLNSLGRWELNRMYIKPGTDHEFDAQKYKRTSIALFLVVFILFGAVGVVATPLVTLPASVLFFKFGIEAWNLSKIK